VGRAGEGARVGVGDARCAEGEGAAVAGGAADGVASVGRMTYVGYEAARAVYQGWSA